eukprot:c10697_g1_i1.p1 GENE.c10697_g1_i1~~c10697_g1_i1.p1  ORF type:complete len:286 (+),score=40.64 c10697_g1_i1:37-894(+)
MLGRSRLARQSKKFVAGSSESGETDSDDACEIPRHNLSPLRDSRHLLVRDLPTTSEDSDPEERSRPSLVHQRVSELTKSSPSPTQARPTSPPLHLSLASRRSNKRFLRLRRSPEIGHSRGSPNSSPRSSNFEFPTSCGSPVLKTDPESDSIDTEENLFSCPEFPSHGKRPSDFSEDDQPLKRRARRLPPSPTFPNFTSICLSNTSHDHMDFTPTILSSTEAEGERLRSANSVLMDDIANTNQELEEAVRLVEILREGRVRGMARTVALQRELNQLLELENEMDIN